MNIKLLEEVNDTPTGSIVECSDEKGKALIGDGKAIAYDESTSKSERKSAIKALVAKNTSIEVKEIKMVTKVQEYALAKSFLAVAGKAVTGNSETSSAADGGALVHTGLGDIAKTLTWGSQVYNKCRQIPITQGANAMKIPVSINSFIKATEIAVTNPAEGSAGTNSKAQFATRTLTLTKSSELVPVTSELLEDVPAFEAWLQSELRGKMAMTLDYEVLLGSSGGYTGVNDDSSYAVANTISGTPTLSQLNAIVNSVWQGYLAAEWYMSITMWNLMVNTFGTNANLDRQLIDIAEYKLLGKPVNVIPTMAAADLVYGDFANGYTVISTPDQFAISREVRFLEDEVVFKLTHRGAGASTVAALTTGDSLQLGAFAYKS